MTMKRLKHWQDVVNVVIGLWLLATPWAMGFSATSAPTANAVAVGIALIAAAVGAIFVPRAWEEWTEAALGVWLMASPWLLGFSTMRDARIVAAASGLVVAVLALWTLATDQDYLHWPRDRIAH
jgi:hypothetical protein